MVPYAHHVAQWKAWQAGATSRLYFVVDAWGGYYQVATPYGIHTFRLVDPTVWSDDG